MSLLAWAVVIAAVGLLVASLFTRCRPQFQFALAFTLAYSLAPIVGITS